MEAHRKEQLSVAGEKGGRGRIHKGLIGVSELRWDGGMS